MARHRHDADPATFKRWLLALLIAIQTAGETAFTAVGARVGAALLQSLRATQPTPAELGSIQPLERSAPLPSRASSPSAHWPTHCLTPRISPASSPASRLRRSAQMDHVARRDRINEGNNMLFDICWQAPTTRATRTVVGYTVWASLAKESMCCVPSLASPRAQEIYFHCICFVCTLSILARISPLSAHPPLFAFDPLACSALAL